MFTSEGDKLLEIVLKPTESKLSDLVVVFALSNLLLVPKKPLLLIEQGGLNTIKEALSRSKNKVKINYYGLLCYWILSYEHDFMKYASSPNVNLFIYLFINYFQSKFFPFITSIVKKAGREKMTRIFLKILRNLIQNQSCVSLMIDNDLIGFLEIESRKNFKNEDVKKNIMDVVSILSQNYKVN